MAVAHAQTNPFESEIRAFEAEDAVRFPDPNSIIFIGSSTINNWNDLANAFPKYNVVNRGFGGSETDDAVFFVDRIATPYRAPLIVFYEGDNDVVSSKTVDQIFSDTTNFFARVQVKNPNTHILYISIKPSPSRASYMTKMQQVNTKVREFTELDPKLHYVDVFTPMLNTSGQPRPELFLSDNLHMNSTGYALWTSILGPVLDDFAAAYPIPIAKGSEGSLLIDFGDAAFTSGPAAPASTAWNNVGSVATSNTGSMANLRSTAGVATGLGLQMVSRFNGANESGTTSSTLFPASATRDSLFGNTETFGGLSNITPIFKLTGLAVAASYRFTFYASRTGATDNRQTRYMLTGATSATADLNAANNIDQVATIASIQPDANGAITIALTPGPSNNNMQRFTYLGVLKVEAVNPTGPTFLFDFGADGSPTTSQTGPAAISWNNVLPEIGATDTGSLSNLIATNGLATPFTLQMTSHFNGPNANGTTNATIFPATATRDSLFGNTEIFGDFANVTPSFKLQNLDPTAAYELAFYASRTGATDNRETRYTVAGAATNFVDLNPANNTNGVAVIDQLKPDADSEFSIALTPGPNNNNEFHFTYLGVMRLNWATAITTSIKFKQTVAASGQFEFSIQGVPGMIYTLQSSTDLENWHDVALIPQTESETAVTIPEPPASVFFRLLQ